MKLTILIIIFSLFKIYSAEKLTVNFERKSNQDSLKFSNLNKFELLKIDSLVVKNIHKSKSKSLDVKLPINGYFDSVGLVLNLNEKSLYFNGINIQTSSGKEIKRKLNQLEELKK